MLGHAGARIPGLALDLAGEHIGQERRDVHREARLPIRAAVGVILRWNPVERAPDLTELPLDADLCGVGVLAFQAGHLAPAQPGVGDRDDHGEVVGTAGQQHGPFGDE